jgi:hypothetical protein
MRALVHGIGKVEIPLLMNIMRYSNLTEKRGMHHGAPALLLGFIDSARVKHSDVFG